MHQLGRAHAVNPDPLGACGRRRVDDKTCVFQRRAGDRKNGLLACLPDADFDRLKPLMAIVQLNQGDVLCESGAQQSHVYFPVSAVVSLMYFTESGGTSEMASVGCDGMVGIGLFMGGNSTTSRAVVQRSGTAYRLSAVDLHAAFNRGGAEQHLLLRYTQALLTQMSQTAACNRHHSLHQQLCRWLLLSLDMAPHRDILMTHESIAHALGVRREGVTEAAGKLREDSAIDYERGRITVLDRAKLEAGTCECYALVKRENERLLPRRVAS